MNEHTGGGDAAGRLQRARDRIRGLGPLEIGALGFLAVPSYYVEELAPLQLFALFWLAWLWPFVGPLVAALRPGSTEESETDDPREWLEMGGVREHLAFLASLVPTFLNPLVFRQDLLQLAGSGLAYLRHRRRLPAPGTFEQSVRYRLPVAGTWSIVNGSPIKEHSHSWLPVTQRYAYDFVITDEDGRTRPADTDSSLENYYCYEAPVVAPADGVVVGIRDGDPESPRAGGFSHPFKRSIPGNAVTIRHAPDEYSVLAHLVPGSLEVSVGDRVERGQQLARCGHSGNSSEPHLHFQVGDHPAFELAAGLPIRFDAVDAETPGVDVSQEWEGRPAEDDGDEFGRYVHVGQRVTHDEDRAVPADPDADAVPQPPGGALSAVTAAGRVGAGMAAGGLLAFAAAIFVGSWSTVAGIVAGATLLGTGYAVGRHVLGDRQAIPTLGVPGGALLVAAAVGTLGWLGGGSGVDLGLVGIGAFVLGSLVYVGAWEYGARRLRDSNFSGSTI